MIWLEKQNKTKKRWLPFWPDASSGSGGGGCRRSSATSTGAASATKSPTSSVRFVPFVAYILVVNRTKVKVQKYEGVSRTCGRVLRQRHLCTVAESSYRTLRLGSSSIHS